MADSRQRQAGLETIKKYKVVITANGTLGYCEQEDKVYKNADGQLHREDGPAVEYANGEQRWYINGKLHRTDGPAIAGNIGTKTEYAFWFINGICHREDGPAVECNDGSKFWYINGKLQRVDGPAAGWADWSKATTDSNRSAQ